MILQRFCATGEEFPPHAALIVFSLRGATERHMPTYIDIFAGAGGLSEGFIRNGFVPVSHIEANADACFTLKTRAAYYYLKRTRKLPLYRRYLRGSITREQLYAFVPKELLDQVHKVRISGWNIDGLFKAIEKNMTIAGVANIDVLVGGPPCQPFSIVGRGALRLKERETRANLYRFFPKFLRRFKPKAFVFENVPGMLSIRDGAPFRKILESITPCGYHVEYSLLDAYKFGVLQQRKRLIIIGWQKKIIAKYPRFNSTANGNIVGELFRDLPPLAPGDDGSKLGYSKRMAGYVKKHSLRGPGDVLTLHKARPHNYRDRTIYRKVIEHWTKTGRRLKYRDLPPYLKTRSNENDFLDRFKVVAPDLSFSHTLLAVEVQRLVELFVV
jgi:DNA (cytosine-5)-methyltransferase 1